MVLYGGNKAGFNTCSLGSGDWRWNSVTASGSAPPDRRYHSAVMVENQLTFFGGSSLADGSELSDMFWLMQTPDGSWAWGWPSSHTPYVRYVVGTRAWTTGIGRPALLAATQVHVCAHAMGVRGCEIVWCGPGRMRGAC